MESNYEMSISNEKIWLFYNKTCPNLDFEASVLMFIDIMAQLNENMNKSLDNSLAKQLLDTMTQLKTDVSKVSSDVQKIQKDTYTNFNVKFMEFKNQYIEDIKMILTTNVSDKIAPLLKEQNTMLLDKTHLLINELIPQNNKSLTTEISGAINNLHQTITTDTSRFLKSAINKDTLNGFILQINEKFDKTLSTNQSFSSATEARLDTSIRDIKFSTETNLNLIKDLSTSTKEITSSLDTNVSSLLKKMEVSSVKGKISENVLSSVLHSLYPVAQIDSVGTSKETGDIMLIRKEKPKILIENKCWDKNVVQEEVKKFIHDVETQDCSGLFLSQNYGIANKENYEININNGNVLVYIHEVNNNPEKIKIGIDIIDHFKTKLNEVKQKNEIDTISKEVLDAINSEYQAYCTRKLNLIKTVKDFEKTIVKQINMDFNIPTLDNYLSMRYASSTSKVTCKYCNYGAKNHQALSAHLRGCKIKKQMEGSNTNIVINTN